jgi:hypothetical protein
MCANARSQGVILVNMVTSRNPWRRADLEDQAFSTFCQDPAGYILNTLPVSRDIVVLLLRIFKTPCKSRISISSIRKAILDMDRLLLTPAEAAVAPDTAYESAVVLFEIIAVRRPHMLAKHYEDICAYFPDLAEGLCERLKLDMVKHGLIDNIDNIFSENALEPVYHIPRELPEWSIPLEIRSGQLDEVIGYPQSPDMSRDNSTETMTSEGPITPATHPTQIVDDVPEVVLDEVSRVEHKLDELKAAGSAEQTSAAALSAFSSRIARVLGSTGNLFR